VGLCGATGNAQGPHLHLDLRVPAEMLSTIERAIGKPRPGWGPEMHPFGISIPGEPWIPVDAYRKRVRRDAEKAGIPLLSPSAPRNRSLTYRSIGSSGEPYPAWLRAIRGESGVYVIRVRIPPIAITETGAWRSLGSVMAIGSERSDAGWSGLGYLTEASSFRREGPFSTRR
jgi:hypothetical protein